MPYYCTVPRCTSMAGKAKNVSFHQFPRDVELAKLWNDILKRGKPYTKYSKVCSLHFRPEDYTITSVGKNKGQWRTLRKDAIPSRNLPADGPSTPTRRSSGAWLPSAMPAVDPQIQHQMAQAIYLQTMLAMQVSSNNGNIPIQNLDSSSLNNADNPHAVFNSETENLLLEHNVTIERSTEGNNHQNQLIIGNEGVNSNRSFKCDTCTKCFKDPDVFVLHKRTHNKELIDNGVKREIKEEEGNIERENRQEKENFNTNKFSSDETLRANPILVNLLKSNIHNRLPDANNLLNSNTNNVLNIESQIMATLTANMENYVRNFSSIFPNAIDNENSNESSSNESNELSRNENNSLELDDHDKLNNDNLPNRENEYDQNISEDNFDRTNDKKLSIKVDNEEKSSDLKSLMNHNNLQDQNKSGYNNIQSDFSNDHSSKDHGSIDDRNFNETVKTLFNFESDRIEYCSENVTIDSQFNDLIKKDVL